MLSQPLCLTPHPTLAHPQRPPRAALQSITPHQTRETFWTKSP